jgi:hypothetical protein
MAEQPQLHSSIVAMVSLAAGIAAKHPDMGPCQLDRLRKAGVPQHQIDAVIEIARHLRDEAAQKFDAAFDECAKASVEPKVPKGAPLDIKVNEVDDACCMPTPGGQSCC